MDTNPNYQKDFWRNPSFAVVGIFLVLSGGILFNPGMFFKSSLLESKLPEGAYYAVLLNDKQAFFGRMTAQSDQNSFTFADVYWVDPDTDEITSDGAEQIEISAQRIIFTEKLKNISIIKKIIDEQKEISTKQHFFP